MEARVLVVEDRKGVEGNEVGKEDKMEVEVMKIRARNERKEGEVIERENERKKG